MNIAIYTFNSITDTLPEFNDGYVYTYTDVDNGDNTTTRTITSDTLPTSMSFKYKSTSLLSVDYLNTSNVTSIANMFRECRLLNSINLSNCNTSNVTDMSYMFVGCSALKSIIGINNLNTDNVTNMAGMFNGCYKLTSLDISSFNTSKVTSVSFMFEDCTNLTTINLNNFDISKASSYTAIFRDCTKLKTINMENSNTTSINKVISSLPTRAASDRGTLKTGNILASTCDTTTADSKYWNVDDDVVAIYTFNSGTDTLPAFNSGGYTYDYTDVDNGDGTTTRTITSDSLPTSISFSGKTGLVNLSYLNTSDLNIMKNMFVDCYNLTSIDVSSFDTSNVTTMQHMFANCSKLTSLDLSSFDTSNVTNMQYMFYNCNSLTSLDLSSFDTSKVNIMNNMFYSCSDLTSLDLSSWHTPFLENMKAMFTYCNSLRTLNLCNWDLTYYQVQSGESILYNVIPDEINLSNCSLITVNKIIQMLPSMVSSVNPSGLLVSEDVAKEIDNDALVKNKGWSVIKTLIAEYVFNTNIDTYPEFSPINDGTGLLYHYSSFCIDTLNADSTTRKIYTYNVVIPASISFMDCTGLLSVQYLNASNLKNMHGMFNGCTNLLSVNASDWDISKVTTMIRAFNGCNKLTILDIADWDVSNVTSMHSMFRECSSLTSLDLSNWDVSKVTGMDYMFCDCSNLTSLNLKYWNTKSVTSMDYMFNNCSKLTSLDLSSFSTYNVTYMRNMFDNCNSLATLYLNNWNMTNVQYSSNLMPSTSHAKLNYVNVINSDENTIKTIQNYLPEKANLGDGALIIGDHIKKGITDSKNWKVFKQTVKKNTITSSMLKYLLNSLKNKFALKSEVDGKVDKVKNKVLSTNDYTNDDYERCKNILSNIELKYNNSVGNNYLNYKTSMTLSFNNLNEEYYTSVLIAPDRVNRFGIEIKDINKIKFTYINGEEFSLTLEEIEEDGPDICYHYTTNDGLLVSIILNIIDKTFYVNPHQPSLLENKSNSRAVNSMKPFYIHIPKVAVAEIPFDKYRPSGLIVGCDTNFVCEPDNEYRIYYKYASSLPYFYSSGVPYGEHTLVVEKTRVKIPNGPDTVETVLDLTDKLDSFVEEDNGVNTMDILSLQGLNENMIKKVTMIVNNESIVAEYITAAGANSVGYSVETPDVLLALVYRIEDDIWTFGYYSDEIVINELSVIIEQKNKYVIKEEISYDYKDIPNYYSYIPNEKDTDIIMYFIDTAGVETGKTYLKPVFKNFVLSYEFNSGQNVLPIFNSGFTNYIVNDKTKTNSIERTLTSSNIPSSVSFNNNQNLTKMTYMSGHISNISNVFNNCRNLIESKVYGNQITNMVDTYCNCRNLIGPPTCGPNVTNMWGTYAYCHNLTGNPTSGNNVTDMTATYWNCYNLTGSPVCGPNVTTMYQTYYGCRNITGSPVCGPNVKDMTHAYDSCYNLTGSPICGDKVTNMYYTYSNCINISSNGYFYSNEVFSVKSCFEGKNNSKILNLYVPANSNTINTILHGENKASSLTGEDILYTYVNDEYEPYYVNTNQNVYIYPVSNVIETHNEHKHLIVSYTSANTSTRPTITTTYGNSGYTAKINGNYIKLLKNDTNAIVTYVNFNNNKNITSIRSLSNTITNMSNAFNNCTNLTGSPVCGDNVTSMYYAYYNCRNLTGDFVCGNKVTNMYGTYDGCTNSTGSPVCGPNVIDFTWAYSQCLNITGDPVCGDNVVKMIQTYYNCKNLTGSPVCGPNVVDFGGAYSNCDRLTGSPVCGDKVTNMSLTYNNCSYLTGSPVCGPNVVKMYETYYNCRRLTGSPVCGPNVVEFEGAYNNCSNLTGSPVCGNNVIYMSHTYINCRNLTGSPVCGNNVIYMVNTYYNCHSLTGSPVCGNNVTNMSYAYYNCRNLTGSPVCGNNVTNIFQTYSQCYNLTGSPVCGDKVTNMSLTYYNCTNLTGNPACGNNVIDMYDAYYNCQNLIGQPVCGSNVVNMRMTYQNCYNLTGNPACGPNVNTMYCTYQNCYNLTGNPACGNNVIDMDDAYWDCYNITGRPVCGNNVVYMNNAYMNCFKLTGFVFIGQNVRYMSNAFYGCNNITDCNVYVTSPEVSNVRNSFYSSNGLDIYVPENSQTFNTFIQSSSGQAIKGGVWWSWNNTGNYYYNNSYKFRIIPVNNVVQLYKENELGIITYITTNTAERPSSMTGAVNGYGVLINGNNVKLYKNEENDIITYMSFKDSQTITNVTNMTDSITDMGESFYNCRNLIKVPMCGNNVTTMAKAYYNCINLTEVAIGGYNVSDMSQAYYNCKNIKTNAYFFSNKVNNAQSCFASKDISKRLNIYVPQTGHTSDYNTVNTCLLANEKSLIGSNITWTNSMATNGCYYNTAQNIYIYPVDNAYQSYKENELLIAKYTVTNASSAFLPVYDEEKAIYHHFDTSDSQPWYSDYTEVRYDFLKYNFDDLIHIKIDDTTTEDNFYREITKQQILNNPDGVVYENSLAKIVVLNDNGTIVLKITPYDWADVRFRTSVYYKSGYNFKNRYTVEDITNDDNTITRSVYIKDHNDHPPYLDFRGRVGLKSVDLLKINNPENISRVFEGCTNLEYVNLSELDLSKIKIADYTFADCGKLTKESFANVEFPNLESAASIFRNCPNLQ